jgi:hypothetical protein
MEMLQTYQGFFKNGRFMPLDISPVAIPEEMEVLITVTGRKLPAKSIEKVIMTAAESRLEQRREMLKSITGVIKTDVDVKAMRAERIAQRGLL